MHSASASARASSSAKRQTPRQPGRRGPGLWLGLVAASALLSATALAQLPKPVRSPTAHALPRYAGYVRGWHLETEGKTAPVDRSGRPLLVLYSINTRDRVEMEAASDRGGFAASDLDRAAFVLREPSSGNEHPIEPRLVDLAYRLEVHFAAQEIRVISGYRTPRRRGGSNHGKGRALDVVVPGTSDAEVAQFARQLGFVGVGIYPTSGFVHLDVRDRSYFWSDASGPGRRNRARGILGDVAKDSDQKAFARGEHPTPPLLIRTDVDAALRALPASTSAEPDDEDDDDDGS
jgi:uncharacterized protein YcbK (DUF882 family)